MAELQHSQIKAKLLETVVPLIDMSDIGDHAAGPFETHALSRAVAATAIKMAADVELTQAVSSLVDGGDDNGIDAIHYDSQSKVLFILQSKWNSAHTGSVDSAAVLKFLQGVQDLVSHKKERFNKKVNLRWPAIEDFLTRLTSVRLLVAYSGSTRLDDSIQKRIIEFVKLQNDTSDMFFFDTISQREMFQYFVQEAAPPQIDLTIKLAHSSTKSGVRSGFGGRCCKMV